MNKYIVFAALAVAVIAGLGLYMDNSGILVSAQSTTTTSTTATSTATSTSSSTADMIKVESPTENAYVISPLVIKGEARGGWYFEASFPVKLLDANGKVIAQGNAQAKGDWMTNNFVPFEATLSFSEPATNNGTLVLMNSNASGDPARDREVRIPVRFIDIMTGGKGF